MPLILAPNKAESSLTCIIAHNAASQQYFLSAFLFLFFVGYRVTCLIIHPINSRATSRTSGAKVVHLEQHTNHQVPRTVSEPCCCSRYTCLCCHSNSMSAECISVSALRQNSCFITMSKIGGKTGSPCPQCEN